LVALTGEMAFGELAFTLDHLSVVDIVVKNGDAGKHPLYVPFVRLTTSLSF
jgi:iron transport multicopper oxidase